MTNGSSKSNRQYLMRMAGRQAGQAEQAEQAEQAQQAQQAHQAQQAEHARTHHPHARTQADKEVSHNFVTFLGEISLPRMCPKCRNTFGRSFRFPELIQQVGTQLERTS